MTNNILRDNKFSCYFLNSAGDILIHFLIYFALKIIIMLISKILVKCMLRSLDREEKEANKVEMKKTSKLVKLRDAILKLNSKMGLKFFYIMFQVFQLDFLLAAFANLKFYNTAGYFGIVNLSISIIVVVFYALLIIILFKNSRRIYNFRRKALNSSSGNKVVFKKAKIELEKIDKLKKWEFIEERIEENLESVWRHFIEISMLMEFIIPLVVIIFIDHPWIQTVPLISLILLMAFALLKYRPLRDKRENNFICLVEFFYVLILSGFIVLLISGDQMNQYVKYNIYGYTLVGLLSLVILLHIIYGIIISI